MKKHGKFVNALVKVHFIEENQRSVKTIREQIEYYEKRNLELVTMLATKEAGELAQREIHDTDIKIKALKWTIFDE